jgi:thioredoxin reductase
LTRYETVELRLAEVIDARCRENAFDVVLQDGGCHSSRMLLLATGVVDELPRLAGVERFFGRSVFHCPYCHGWEVRDRPIAMYKAGGRSAASTLELTVWSRDVVLCTDGPADLPDEDWQCLARHSISVHQEKIVRLEGTDGQLERFVFADGSVLPRRAMFFSTGFRQHSLLAARLGCDFIDQPVVDTSRKQTTNLPGLYVAGDAAREAQLAIVAAAEGAKAAFAINAALAAADVAGHAPIAQPPSGPKG